MSVPGDGRTGRAAAMAWEVLEPRIPGIRERSWMTRSDDALFSVAWRYLRACQSDGVAVPEWAPEINALAGAVQAGDVARYPREVRRAEYRQIWRQAGREPGGDADNDAALIGFWSWFEAAATEVVKSAMAIDMVADWAAERARSGDWARDAGRS